MKRKLTAIILVISALTAFVACGDPPPPPLEITSQTVTHNQIDFTLNREPLPGNSFAVAITHGEDLYLEGHEQEGQPRILAYENIIINDSQNIEFSITGLKANTDYFFQVGEVDENNNFVAHTPLNNSSYGRARIPGLRNMQTVERYGRVSVQYEGHINIPENTEDTIYFQFRFVANPDFLARFDINGDGIVDERDVEVLRNYLFNDLAIENPSTVVGYTRPSGAFYEYTVTRGSLHGTGTVTEDDLAFLEWLLDGRMDEYGRAPDLSRPDDKQGTILELRYISDVDECYVVEELHFPDFIPKMTEDSELPVQSFTNLTPGVTYYVRVYTPRQLHYNQLYDDWELASSTAAE
jgi:hypothetical protein